MQKAWTDDAWADYLYWQTQDKKTLEHMNDLFKDIDRLFGSRPNRKFNTAIESANNIIKID